MLVPFDEMRAYMGGLEFTAMQEAEMKRIINGVQQTLELYLNRPVEPVQIREIATANFQGVIYTTVTPVLKVLKVNSDLSVIDPNNLYIPAPMNRDTLFDINGRLVDKFPTQVSSHYRPVPGGIAGAPFRSYYLEYIGGLQGYALEAIKLGIKRVAAREWATNHVDTAGNRVGNADSTQQGDARFLGWATDELKAFERYRRRIAIR